MPTERKYYSSPLYYPDDKDLRDFLRATSVGERKLRFFLSKRGILCPKTSPVKFLINRISNLTLSWDDLVELVDLVDIGDRREKNTFENIEFSGAPEELADAFERVKEARQLPEKETYSISQNGKRVIVEVDYVTIDNSKTPMLQGRPAKLVMEAEQVGDVYTVTHTSNELASNIMNDVLLELTKSRLDENVEEEEEIARKKISLSQVLSAELRVDFFSIMAKGLTGFSYEHATNAKVARFQKMGGIDGDGDDQLTELEEESLRGVILQGIDIEKSSHYKKLLEAGFFISSLTWDTLDQSNNDRVSFTAGFKKAEEGEGFEFSINHKFQFDQGDYRAKEKIPPATTRRFSKLLQASAQTALEEILEKAAVDDGGPSGEE